MSGVGRDELPDDTLVLTGERPVARKRDEADWAELCRIAPWGTMSRSPAEGRNPAPEAAPVAPVVPVAVPVAVPSVTAASAPEPMPTLSRSSTVSLAEAFSVWAQNEGAMAGAAVPSQRSAPVPDADPVATVLVSISLESVPGPVAAREVGGPDAGLLPLAPAVEAMAAGPPPRVVEPEPAIALPVRAPVAAEPHSRPSEDATMMAVLASELARPPVAPSVATPQAAPKAVAGTPVKAKIKAKAKVKAKAARVVPVEAVVSGVVGVAAQALRDITLAVGLGKAAPVKKPAGPVRAAKSQAPVSAPPVAQTLGVVGKVGREVGVAIRAITGAGSGLVARAGSVVGIGAVRSKPVAVARKGVARAASPSAQNR